MRTVADYIARVRRRGDQPVVVVSAMGKETDDLIHLASQVSDTRPGREMDMLITAGERKSMALLCMALHDLGVPADSFTGSQAGMITDNDHTRAKILEVRPDRIREALAAGRVPVVGGAQGVSVDRDVTFLGRSGSDITAVALAAALGAEACELYTDVSGVFTADPRVVPVRPPAVAGVLRGHAGDERGRVPQAGDALGGVRPQPWGTAPCPLQLHLGARDLDRGGGPVVGAAHHLGGDLGRVGGQAHRDGRARPAGHRRPPVPGAGRPVRQRRHDRAERVDPRHDRHLLHRPPCTISASPSRSPAPWPPRSGRPTCWRTARSPRCH